MNQDLVKKETLKECPKETRRLVPRLRSQMASLASDWEGQKKHGSLKSSGEVLVVFVCLPMSETFFAE